MTLESRLFGPIDYEPEDIIHFPNGLPSFNDEHQFLLIPMDPNGHGPFCLQSIRTPALSFILMNPFSLCPSYAPILCSSERKDLGVSRNEDLCFYVLCAMKRPVQTSTVNMKCPIALNPDTKTAFQVILETDQFHMRHPLSEFSHGKEGVSC